MILQSSPRRAIAMRGWVVYCGLSLAALLYWAVIPANNTDIERYLLPWLRYILENGITQSLGDNFYNYTPPYIYFLCISSRLHGLVSEVAIIKSVPCVFAFVTAALVGRLQLSLQPDGRRALCCGVVFLVVPTVVLNAPFWGQADILPASALIAFLLYVVRRRPMAATVCFGVALAFKLQAIFLAPYLLCLMIRREVPWWHLFTIPLVYVVMMAPAALAGRPWSDLLTIYASQGAYYHSLSMNAPNFYLYARDLGVPYTSGVAVGCVVTFLAGLFLAVVGARRLKGDAQSHLCLALLSAALMPFLLPKMHDRYFFFADVLAYVVAVNQPRLWWMAVGFQCSSALAYSAFLFGFQEGPYLGAGINSLLILGIAFEVHARHLTLTEGRGAGVTLGEP